jgi:hypothetical protein
MRKEAQNNECPVEGKKQTERVVRYKFLYFEGVEVESLLVTIFQTPKRRASQYVYRYKRYTTIQVLKKNSSLFDSQYYSL